MCDMFYAMRVFPAILLALPFLAVAAVTDVECGPPDFRTGKAGVRYTVDASDSDPLTRLVGIVVDRDSGRPLRRATLLDLPGDALAPGRHRVVWDVLADIPFRPVSTTELRLFVETVPSHEAKEEEEENEHSPLLYYCTFDDPSSITAPVAGPAGTFLGGEFVPGRKGNALLVKALTPAAETRFPVGLMQPRGRIEFWATIPGATKETRFPDGGNPQFFAMEVGPWINTFVKYTANDGFGTGGLHADLPGSAYVSSEPSWSGNASYPDFLGDPAAWHHYALVWSESGLDAASEALGRRVISALYVDGKLVNPSYGHNGPDRATYLREFVSSPIVLSFPFVRGRQEPRQGQVDYVIDEFKIWATPEGEETENTQAGLLFHCSLDSVEAISACGGTVSDVTFVEGVNGMGVQVGHAKDPICFPLENVITNFRRGSVEVWAKILEPDLILANSANELNLVNLRQVNDDIGNFFRITLTTNNGHGQSGLIGGISTHDKASTHIGSIGPFDIMSAIGGNNPKEWHHYRLSWDADGIGGGNDRTAVFVDGCKVVSSTEPLFEIKPAWDHYRYILKISESNGSQPLAVFDELKLWDRAVMPEDGPAR